MCQYSYYDYIPRYIIQVDVFIEIIYIQKVNTIFIDKFNQPSMRLTHDMLDQTKIDRSESIDLILTSNWLLCSNSIYRIDARSTTKTHLPFHPSELGLL